MKLCFLGTSHAAQHLSRAAALNGCELVEMQDAEVVFVSEDTPTNENGERDLAPIRALLDQARAHAGPVVLTSAVPPGFTRSLGFNLWHQAETLRIRDAAYRASYPEMMIVGCADPKEHLPAAYQAYLMTFSCPVIKMSYESAEFAKVAINQFLIAQVDATNILADAAARCGADWGDVVLAMQQDKRIGPHAYLTPGRWQDSRHLLRDHVTLREICLQS